MTSDTALPVELEPCPCERCEKPVSYDLIVPDEVWARISPQPVEGWKGGGVLCPECIVAAIIALSPTRTAVKPLTWQIDAITGMWWADSAFGRYKAWDMLGVAYYRFAGGSPVRAGSTDVSARAAAQTDYERRILSALSTTEGE